MKITANNFSHIFLKKKNVFVQRIIFNIKRAVVTLSNTNQFIGNWTMLLHEQTVKWRLDNSYRIHTFNIYIFRKLPNPWEAN